MKKWGLWCLFLGVMGCAPPLRVYQKVPPLVKPKGRPIAVLPFRAAAKAATENDGIALAVFAARELKDRFPALRVLGPSDMKSLLREPLNESRWNEIARKARVSLLIVGEIRFLDVYYDSALQQNFGHLVLRLRVLDASRFPPRRLATVHDMELSFPESRADRWDPRFASMDAKTFRNHLLRFAGRWIAGLFYGHVERAKTAVRTRGSVRTE